MGLDPELGEELEQLTGIEQKRWIGGAIAQLSLVSCEGFVEQQAAWSEQLDNASSERAMEVAEHQHSGAAARPQGDLGRRLQVGLEKLDRAPLAEAGLAQLAKGIPPAIEPDDARTETGRVQRVPAATAGQVEDRAAPGHLAQRFFVLEQPLGGRRECVLEPRGRREPAQPVAPATWISRAGKSLITPSTPSSSSRLISTGSLTVQTCT